MDNLSEKISSLIVFNTKQDELIKALYKLNSDNELEAIEAYAELCRILLCSNKTLSEYIHELMLYCDCPLIEAYIKNDSELQYAAICSEVAIMTEIAALKSSDIKSYLCGKCKTDFPASLPDFATGDFTRNASYFIEHVRSNGSGIYAKYKAFSYKNSKILPVIQHDTIRLNDLKKYEAQRKQIIENTLCFINGENANNVLLYGDRGTGKSSTIKALLNEYRDLRIVQIDKNEIPTLFSLYDLLAKIPLKFIVFIDDLTFSEDDDGFNVLKQALDGSLSVRPKNVVIYATTNRRHIIKESNASRDADAVHRSDAVDESMSLADRFGLFVTFTSPNKNVYLEIVQELSKDMHLEIDQEELFAGAERFSLKRGGRSPRIARQYVEMLSARLACGLELI